MSQRPNQQAVRRLIRHQSRTRIAPLQQGFDRINAQAAADFLSTVTLEALRRENRSDPGLEELFAFIGSNKRRTDQNSD